MFPLEITVANDMGGEHGLDTFSEIGSVLQTCGFYLADMISWLQGLHISEIVEACGSLRELTVESVILRMLLAIVLGGSIGLERGRKSRPAGFRTYMVVCLGATLTMILGQYELWLSENMWAVQAGISGARTDITRFGAQVINGIGFLGAGTILITGRQQVKGLTTAASLWASACMGLALGAAFYECAILAFVLMIAAMRFLPKLEAFLIEKARNMNIYIELVSLDGINEVIGCLKALNIQIYDVDIERGKKSQSIHPNAAFSIRLAKHQSHTQVVAALSKIENVVVIKES